MSDALERVQVRGHLFPVSPLLGPRAEIVYRCFLDALAVKGDVAECGAYEGVTALGMAEWCYRHAPERTVHVFDSFAGFPDLITEEERSRSTWEGLGPGLYASALPAVLARARELPNVRVHAGAFSETFPAFEGALAFIHSDSDLYVSTVETIDLAARALVTGGVVLFDDYGNPRLPGVQLAVDRHLDPDRFRGARIPGTIQYLATRRPS